MDGINNDILNYIYRLEKENGEYIWFCCKDYRKDGDIPSLDGYLLKRKFDKYVLGSVCEFKESDLDDEYLCSNGSSSK